MELFRTAYKHTDIQTTKVKNKNEQEYIEKIMIFTIRIRRVKPKCK